MNTNDYTLYSIVMLLAPTHETTVAATMGHQAHAAFLRTVQDADPALAEVLHTPNLPVRPFTVSPLRGGESAPGHRLRLVPEGEYWLRFTVLYPPIFEQFMARFLEGRTRPALRSDGLRSIRLGSAVLGIREIRVTPGSHPWAGATSWARLAGETRPTDTLCLEFCSPTAFGFGQKTWGKQIVVLPDPELVFGSLLRSWNTLAPPPLQIERDPLLAYLKEHVVIKRLEALETQMLRFRSAPQVGFTGRVTYGLMAPDMAAQCQLNALAGLAFYSGVGMKTAMGMGQVRWIVE